MGGEARTAATIDVGSNSVHLLLAEFDGDGLAVLRDESVLLGLGAVVDMEGLIPDDELRAAIDALAGYVELAQADGAEWVTLLGTEPLRRASNRSRFCAAAEAATGRPFLVLGHDEEALLTVLGVLAGKPVAERLLVLDIGGGSSEVALLEPGRDPVVGIMPVGSARLTAQHVEDDPPTTEEVAALRSEAHHLLAGMPVGHPERGIVVGGSGTNLVRLTTDEGDEEHVDALRIDRGRCARAIEIVMERPSHELAGMYGLRERRVVQMAAGAALIEATLDCYDLDELEPSDASLREGAILAHAAAGDAWRERLTALVTRD